jgi:hypothetical protein
MSIHIDKVSTGKIGSSEFIEIYTDNETKVLPIIVTGVDIEDEEQVLKRVRELVRYWTIDRRTKIRLYKGKKNV